MLGGIIKFVISRNNKPEQSHKNILYEEFGSICENVHEFNSDLKVKLAPSRLDRIIEFFTSIKNWITKEERVNLVFNNEFKKIQNTWREDYKNLINPVKIDFNIEEFNINQHFHEMLERDARRDHNVIFEQYLRDNNIVDHMIPTERFNQNIFTQPELEEFENELHELAKSQSLLNIDRLNALFEMEGSNPNIRTSYGNTFLHIAISAENLPVIRLLLNYGADLFIKNNKEETPYELALKSDLVQDLFKSDPVVNEKVRKQRYDHSMDELLKKEEIKSKLGKSTNSYQAIPDLNSPVHSLKELCVEKIVNTCHAAR